MLQATTGEITAGDTTEETTNESEEQHRVTYDLLANTLQGHPGNRSLACREAAGVK